MDDTKHHNDFPALIIDQIRELAAAVREDFGDDLARAAFTESLLTLLEDVPGYEMGSILETLIECAWAEYGYQ